MKCMGKTGVECFSCAWAGPPTRSDWAGLDFSLVLSLYQDKERTSNNKEKKQKKKRSIPYILFENGIIPFVKGKPIFFNPGIQ